MINDKVKEIMELNEKIDNIIFKTTSFFDPTKQQELNQYDKKMLDYYQKTLDLIIEIAKEEKTKDIEVIDQKYFQKEENASSVFFF